MDSITSSSAAEFSNFALPFVAPIPKETRRLPFVFPPGNNRLPGSDMRREDEDNEDFRFIDMVVVTVGLIFFFFFFLA